MNNITDIGDKVAKRRKNKPGEKKNDGDDNIIDSDFIKKCLSRNEQGDGELFKKLFGNDFVYNKAMNCWFSWSGHHFQIDKMDYALASVDVVANVYQDEAKKITKKMLSLESGDPLMASLEFQRKELNKRATALRSKTRRKNCVHFAQTSRDSLAIDGHNIDRKPFLLPCANGVVNLKTGELESGRQEDYLMKASSINFPKEGVKADCPTFKQTLFEIFSENQSLVDFFQRLLGYCLVGKVVNSIMVVLTGRGRNGKSLIVETISKIMGELSGAIRSEMLLDQFRIASSAGPTPDIMALKGIRFAFASETDENCRISTSKVKWLTGNDTLTGRSPHDKYQTSFKPSHTLFLLTNNKPHAPAEDFAFWERVILIPFDLSFVNREPRNSKERRADLYLSDKLEEELPEIFAWMVLGCLEWQDQGLNPPIIVKEAVSEYRRAEDTVSDFIDECCIVSPECRVGATAIYEAFKIWWQANVSNRVPSQKKVGGLLTMRFEKKQTPKTVYMGIGLLKDS